MDRSENKKREAELDAFWDIDALIPAKRAPHYASDTTTTEIVLDAPSAPVKPSASQAPIVPEPIPSAASDSAEPRFIPPHTKAEFTKPAPDEEYAPDNALVRTVRIYRHRGTYRYYEGFVRDAARLYPVKGGVCSRVPFFSYVPQHSQMTRPQLEWYLYWRDQVRHGGYPDTDYSYILLYIYELINLSDRIAPEKVQKALCNIWVQYRKLFHQLDTYLPEWICDHSLLHRLPPPEICTGEELLPVVMQHCALKEFYMPRGVEDGFTRAILTFCSNYDYRKSKFYVGENISLFDRAIEGAVRRVTETASRDGKLFAAANMDDSRMTRDAYTGALCSYRIKRKLEVEYCSFSRSHELRYFITDVIKYTENRIRAALGIRSRLTIYALPVSTRQLLDAYLDGVLPTRTVTSPAKKEAAEAQVYEKLYDLPQKPLSLSGAAEIERASWETTQKLVEAFTQEDREEPTPVPVPASMELAPSASESAETDGEGKHTAFLPYRDFLRGALERELGVQKAFAKTRGVPVEVVADEINTLAADLLGDILLEEDNGIFTVIEDYRSIAEDLL